MQITLLYQIIVIDTDTITQPLALYVFYISYNYFLFYFIQWGQIKKNTFGVKMNVVLSDAFTFSEKEDILFDQ